MARFIMVIGPTYRAPLNKPELQSRLTTVIIRLSKTILIKMAKTLMSLPLLLCTQPLQVMAFIMGLMVHACMITCGTTSVKRQQ